MLKINHNNALASTKTLLHFHCLLLITFTFLSATVTAAYYADALSKSLLYFEAQRSGRLPYNQRVMWRDHSGLTDGLQQGVGDGDTDHYCWQRSEDMTTSRRAHKIDEANPGSDVAGETTAAMAAASIVFRKIKPLYSCTMLNR
ncbi:hypothetical protein RND81_08G082200 [Saponaria officinalis]